MSHASEEASGNSTHERTVKINFFLKNWGARLQIFKKTGGGARPPPAPMDGTPMTLHRLAWPPKLSREAIASIDFNFPSLLLFRAVMLLVADYNTQSTQKLGRAE